MRLFILPGNPPAQHFYRIWVDELRERVPSLQAQIAFYPLQVEATSDSLAYFERLVEALRAQLHAFTEREPADLVGHSLGGNLALQLLERDFARVERAHLLHPFLRRPRPKARALLQLAYQVSRRAPVAEWLVRAQPWIGRFLPDAHALTADEIRVFIQLAGHEHRTIAQNRSPLLLDSALKPKLRAYTTPGDIWCPPNVVEALARGSEHMTGPVPHDFVVHRRGRDRMTAFLLKGLNGSKGRS